VLESRPKTRDRRPARTHEQRASDKRTRPLKAALVLAVASAIAGGVWLAKHPGLLVSASVSRSQIIVAAHQFVKQSLDEDLKATFSNDDVTRVEDLPGGKIQVSGRVDLVYRDGRALHRFFTVVLERAGADGWSSDSVSITANL
jgi:hypothetical protein